MSKWCRAGGVTLVACSFLLAGLTPAPAESKNKGEHKGTNNAQGNDRAKAKNTPASDAIAQTQLALSLARYGREHKNATALIAAAEILAKVPPMQKGKEKPATANNAGADNQPEDKSKGPQEAAADTNQADPESLLAEARKLAPNDRSVAELADKVARSLEEKPRGVSPAPVTVRSTVVPGFHDTWTFTYRAGEIARVNVDGDGREDLALDVYDENNNYIIGFTGPSPYAWWYPKWQGPFRIEVTNNGRFPVSYTLYTN